MTAASGTVLVVVDVQNDFCAGPLAASRYPGAPGRLEAVTASTARAVDAARGLGTEVLFVRFLGDVRHQGESWRRRDAVLGKRPKCLEGSWGAQFPAALAPAPGESIFTKRACFDAFLSDGFEQHLIRSGTGHLVFAGLFADVCVDSTARTAFQKGFHVTVLEDCTTGLHLPDKEILRFMSRVYGARVTTHDQVAAWSRHPAAEDTWPAPPERTSVWKEASG
ncbi:cysteine hydrolase family protein [Streptomyces sp. NPDC055287]